MNYNTLPNHATRLLATLTLILSLLVAPIATATQHLISPGQSWERLADELKPGDEIILFPGRHMPAELPNVQGTAKQPIIIRSLDPRNPATIIGHEFGLILSQPQYVRLKDITIVGATEVGLRIDDGDPMHRSERSELWAANLTLENIKIIGTGPDEEADAMQLIGLRQVRLSGGTFDGWANVAINIRGCMFVHVEDCEFLGRDEFTQQAGVRIGGGSNTVRVSRSTFNNAGPIAIDAGSPTPLRAHRPMITDETDDDGMMTTHFEVTRLAIDQCDITGSERSIVIDSTDRATVRSCTIENPGVAAIHFAHRHDEPRIQPMSRCTIGENLFLWNGELVKQPIAVSNAIANDALIWEENLWWPGSAIKDSATLQLPGEMAFDQITSLDPQFDQKSRTPRKKRAQTFGSQSDLDD